MADVDIDPLEDMNRELKNQLTKIFLLLRLPQEDQLGNQTEESKKLHSEENLKELN